MDLHTVVSGVFHAMQEVAISEILGLLRAQLAKNQVVLTPSSWRRPRAQLRALSERDPPFPETYEERPTCPMSS